MFDFKKAAAVMMSAAIAAATFTVPAFADDSEDITAYLCYSDSEKKNSNWEEGSDAAPSVKITGDGDYTVEYDCPDGMIDTIAFLGVQFNGATTKFSVTTKEISVDGTAVDISDDFYNTYVDSIYQLKIIEDSDGETSISEFKDADKISVTFTVSGLSGEAEETADGDDTAATSENLTADSSAPTLAFDSDDWSGYIEAYDSTGANTYTLKKESDVVYQGAAIKLSADLKTAVDYSTDNETTMGVLFKAESFGLENFDGYTLNFYARFNVNVEGLLFDDCVYAFGRDAEGNMTSQTIKSIQYNTTSNVNGYEKQFVTIPPSSNTTEILIKVPLASVYSGDVMYFDNVTLISSQQDSDGNLLQIKSLDTFNSNAKVTNTGDVIKQNVKGNTLSEDESTAADESSGFNPMIIVVVVLVAALVAVVVVVIIKHKNKYY